MKNAIFVTMASVSLNINYLFLHMNTKKITFGALRESRAHIVVFCSSTIPNRILGWKLTPVLLPESDPCLAVCCSFGGAYYGSSRPLPHFHVSSQSEMSLMLFCPLSADEP